VVRALEGLAPAMDAPTPITLLLARFDDLLGRGLRQVISGDPAIAIVAGDVEPARLDAVLRAHRPRVALLDVDALESLAGVRDLSRRHPHVRLVLMAGHPSAAESAQLLAFGASACLGRDTQARDVLSAIHLASRGLQLSPRRPPGDPARPVAATLTRREAEVLPLLEAGRSNAQIAAELGIGVETVRSHARNVYRKLGVASRRELAAMPAPAPGAPPRRRAGAGGAGSVRPRRGPSVRR
jgi:DNA-binding NarL/FixJ family response regulator